GTHVRHAHHRSTALRDGLVEDELLHRGEVRAAVLLRPGRSDPALLDQRGAPPLQGLAAIRPASLGARIDVRVGDELFREVVVEELLHFLAEDGLLRAVSEVHVVLLLPRTLRRGLSRQGAGAASLQRHPPERRHPTPTPGDFPVDVRVIPARTIARKQTSRKRGGPQAASKRDSCSVVVRYCSGVSSSPSSTTMGSSRGKMISGWPEACEPVKAR